MSGKPSFEKQLKKFFIEIFSEKCLIEDSSMTSEELESVESLSFTEILENLKNIFNELIKFKKNCLEQDKAEILKTNEKFESMLQKLEAEVRNHIRVEHQLKIHIENTQNQTEELQNFNQQLLAQIKDLSDKVKAKGEKKDDGKVTRFESIIAKKDASIAKLEVEIAKLKKGFDGKENSKGFDGFRQKCEENSSELFRLEQAIKERNGKVLRDRNKSVRKSFVEDVSVSKVKKHRRSVKSLGLKEFGEKCGISSKRTNKGVA